MSNYDASKIEKKWQERWRKEKLFSPNLDPSAGSGREPYYNLMMFPYPSAEGLHVGNMYAFTGADIWGRYQRMRGNDVFQPIGLDGFGIHSENYAIKIGEHPREVAKRTEKRFYAQLKSTGNAYDWTRRLETYSSNYYKWTQWVFVQMFKAGLAYRKKSPVNWCPSCKTVLADEQVIAGECERCGTGVEIKELEQWFFRITDYADRLLEGLDKIDWSEKVKNAQRNWIGRSEGAEIKFEIRNSKFEIPVFTTRADTLFGATFLVLSPDSEWVEKVVAKKHKQSLTSYKEAVSKYIKEAQNQGAKSGVFTGSYAINPATEEEIPIWVADYVIAGYGSGAIMGVPAHDERDLEFAKRHNLPVSDAPLVPAEEVLKKVGGRKKVQYHLRDWLISRQRYWGPPIPMIYCEKCARLPDGQGWQPVPEEDLPVELPYIEDYQPRGSGEAPLAQDPSFVRVNCPKCGGEARRETDVSDTFLDSSWYFFRYTSTEDNTCPWRPERARKWLPVHMYIGGAEHSVLHLMYARFVTMAFHDWGLISHFEEPFTRFYAHGLLIAEGAKMSKSRGNVIVPDEYINKYGADTLRAYLMFLGPFDRGGDFRDTGIEGMRRFLNRVWRLFRENPKSALEESRSIRNPKRNRELERATHKAIKRVTEDIEGLRYNRAVAGIMEYVNALEDKGTTEEALKTLVLLLAPFTPHMSEELWVECLGQKFSVHKSSWPKWSKELVKEETVEIPVQVNGRLRATVSLPRDEAGKQHSVETAAKKASGAARHLKGKKVKKVIFVPGRLINFVV